MGFRLHVGEVLASRSGMNMSLLSRKSGIDFKTVKELCRDPHRNTTIETLVRIAIALDASLDELVEIISDENPS